MMAMPVLPSQPTPATRLIYLVKDICHSYLKVHFDPINLRYDENNTKGLFGFIGIVPNWNGS